MVVTASSIKVPQATIISRPANCPALVRFVRDIKNADITESPFSQAKSPKAKLCGVVTGEPIYQAKRKCPNLQIFPGNYKLS